VKVMRAWQWGAVVLAAIYVTRPKGTVTTDYVWRIDPTAYPESIKAFARAIARAEGFYVPNSVPQRARNPGNLKMPNWQGPTINGISVFENVDQGWAALYRQLGLIVSGDSRHYTLDMTIAEMGETWTATVHEQAAWARNVAAAAGASVTDRLWQVLV
jgi:hypothetical protein